MESKAQVAIQQGKYAGALIERRLQGKGLPAFAYQDRSTIATIGRGAAVAQIGRLRLAGLLAWNLWLVVHLRKSQVNPALAFETGTMPRVE